MMGLATGAYACSHMILPTSIHQALAGSVAGTPRIGDAGIAPPDPHLVEGLRPCNITYYMQAFATSILAYKTSGPPN